MVRRIAQHVFIVVFGASGDLAKRKLIPALFHLVDQDLLPDGFTVLGYARTPYSDDEFRDLMIEGLREHMTSEHNQTRINARKLRAFAKNLYYQSGQYDDSESFAKLGKRIAALEKQHKIRSNRLFYLATPPEVFTSVTTLLSEHGLAAQDAVGAQGAEDRRWARLIIEKPFGHDLESAQQLNDHLLSLFSEDQIYRIDHYLGKETVQNILVFRFGNGIFEPIWNRNYIDHVQITVAESLGVEDRGGYYDQAGAIRDMVQNHVMQLVALTAMEPPVAFDGKAVRDQKVNVMQSIRPLAPAEVAQRVVRAQYVRGRVDGEVIPGYLETKGINPHSTTDTYVAWKLEIDNWRWKGVPFYLRTGKAMHAKMSEINIVFRMPPLRLFEGMADHLDLHSNILTLRIQPDEGIRLAFDAKRPGPVVDVDSVNMNFSYGSFGEAPADAYERLLLDAILGDNTLFIRRDEIETAWERVTRVLEGWRKEEKEVKKKTGEILRLPTYKAGTWGPAEADELLQRDGRHWYNPEPRQHSGRNGDKNKNE
jgi:glucose-6-phosphate 1-dehydrogenase